MQSAFYSAGVFLAGVIGDTLGGVVSDRILHRTGDRTAARRNVIVAGMLGGFLFLIPVMLVHDVNVAAISLAAVLCRTGGGADLGSSDGYCAEIFGIGERHDEFRLRRCRHYFAVRIWLSDRSDRKSDLAICRLNWPFVAWPRARVSHASDRPFEVVHEREPL